MQNMAEFRNEQADRSNNICCRSLISTRNGSDEENVDVDATWSLGTLMRRWGPRGSLGSRSLAPLGWQLMRLQGIQTGVHTLHKGTKSRQWPAGSGPEGCLSAMTSARDNLR